jgi:hypothetical protein
MKTVQTVAPTLLPVKKKGNIKMVCDYCGAEYNTFPCHVKEHVRHFCGQVCYKKWFSENVKGELSPHWKGGSLKTKCSQCAKEILIRQADARDHKYHFCSRECDGKWRSENRRGEIIYNRKGGVKASRERRKNNIKERINARMRTMVRYSLKGNKNGCSWEKLVGYSADELKSHLFKTIPKGKTWDDFMNGSLEIDHIIPQCVFNINSHADIDFKKCWGLENLRLLSAKENRSKGGRLSFPFQPSLAMKVAI